MINVKEISGIGLIIIMFIYIIRGNPDNPLWSSYDFTVQDLLMLFIIFCPSLTSYKLKQNKNKTMAYILSAILGVTIFKLIFDLFSFPYPKVWNEINRTYEIGGILLIYVIVIILYKRYGRLVKR
jgi:membrane protease YdiL (CAAX protease family)